ncbi:MAG TPA: leucyl aminopeptidase [Acidimicrobiia bacterium]|nr:leucyl aminopeptidase [Acidimicrobiia bacterium]
MSIAGSPARSRSAPPTQGVRVRTLSRVPADVDVLAVPVWDGRRVPPHAAADLDLRYLEGRGFDGRLGETQSLLADDGGAVVAVGLGDPDALTSDGLRRAAAAAVRAAGRAHTIALTLLDGAPPELGPAVAAQAVVEGALLAAYAFTTFKSDPRPQGLRDVIVVSSSPAAAAGAARGAVVARAVHLARDLINEPAGTLTPRRLATVATTEGRRAGLTVTVVDERAAAAGRLGGLMGVARGSDEPPRLLELLYEPPGATAATPTVAFVGKGITFDSGGLSLKTAAGMATMKTDMSGSAAVLGAMIAIAVLGAPVRVLGLCPITENMPSGTAIKPGDVLRMRSGKTVEVLNTDAEGRLVLADALALATEAGVDAIVDLATLTGAVSTALGRNIAGVMGTDDAWLGQVMQAALRAGERLWALPLPDDYRRDIESEVADIRNTGGNNPAGTLTAGLFLKEFVGDLPWAHLDIAGTARAESDDGYITRGGTGFGVRTLVELASSGKVALRPGATRRARWRGHTPAALLVAGARSGAARTRSRSNGA